MSDKLNYEKKLKYSINDEKNFESLARLGKAISSVEKLTILKAIQSRPMYLVELSKQLNIPLTSVSRHIDALAEAELIIVSYEPGLKGHSKLCSKAVLGAEIDFEDQTKENTESAVSVEMPLGLFTECEITPPCGMAGYQQQIDKFDDPSVFFTAERSNAELIWFNTGFISYNFPIKKKNYSEINFSFEVCSETVYYRDKWPSDITVKINGTEIDTFTSPGDFGGRRGKYTPEYWPVISTQFGILMQFTVNKTGVFVNNIFKTSSVTADKLKNGQEYIRLTLEIKTDAVHRGGINLFGRGFGDYPQSIIMTLK